jgi:hypothetical protein
LHSILLQKQFFLRETRDGFEGVQRRGPVKGAVRPRSSKTLDREHRWITPALKARVEWGKNGEEKDFGQEHRMGNVYCGQIERKEFRDRRFVGAT